MVGRSDWHFVYKDHGCHSTPPTAWEKPHGEAPRVTCAESTALEVQLRPFWTGGAAHCASLGALSARAVSSTRLRTVLGPSRDPAGPQPGPSPDPAPLGWNLRSDCARNTLPSAIKTCASLWSTELRFPVSYHNLCFNIG